MLIAAIRRSLLFSLLAVAPIAVAPAFAQQVERPPATPLITHDPYFSVWSNTDKLTDSPTRHWTGHPQPLASLVRVDGKAFRIMGSEPRNVPAMEQTSLKLTPTHTRYSFTGAGVQIDLTFFTPAFLDDMDLLSRPVTYLTWTAHSTDGAQHDVSVLLSANAEIATSMNGQQVVFSRHRTASTGVLSVGTRDQAVLNRSGDDLRIDWGYFHIAVPDSESAKTSISEHPDRAFASDGALPAADAMDGPVPQNRSAPEMAVALSLGSVGAQPVSKHVLVSYTQGYSIQLLPAKSSALLAAQQQARSDHARRSRTRLRRSRGPRRRLRQATHRRSDRTAGEHYAWICTLAYRQSIAAHKLVADANGNPMLFAKENFSNGCIATVDVIYPSAPFFLFFSPKLLEAQFCRCSSTRHAQSLALPLRSARPRQVPAGQRPGLRRRREDRREPDARRRVRQHADPRWPRSPAPKATPSSPNATGRS